MGTRGAGGSHGRDVTSFSCLGSQVSCLCKPGLVSINHNASAGCFAYCFPDSCDRSATCQLTPDGKTRWARGLQGGHWGAGQRGRAGQGRVYSLSSSALCEQVGKGQEVGTGRTPGPDQFYPVPSCVCKEGEVGDGRACYGHLLHEIQKAGQLGLVLLRLKVSLAMLGV